MNLSAFSDVETQISKIKIENEVDSLKNYISLQGRVQIHFFSNSQNYVWPIFLRFRIQKNVNADKNMNSLKS